MTSVTIRIFLRVTRGGHSLLVPKTRDAARSHRARPAGPSVLNMISAIQIVQQAAEAAIPGIRTSPAAACRPSARPARTARQTIAVKPPPSPVRSPGRPRNPFHRWSWGTAGHTLLELIIVLSMISLIVAITGGAMSLASRSVDSGERHIGSLERFRTSLNIVDSQIQSFMPILLQGSDPVTDRGYIFRGDSTSLLFSAGRSLWNSQGGYVVVQYKVESDGDGKQFLRIAEKMIGMKNENTTRLFVLYDSIYFEYFLKEPAEEKGTWVEQWTDNKVIPAMIRLNLIAGAKRLAVIIPVRVGQAVNKRLSL